MWHLPWSANRLLHFWFVRVIPWHVWHESTVHNVLDSSFGDSFSNQTTSNPFWISCCLCLNILGIIRGRPDSLRFCPWFFFLLFTTSFLWFPWFVASTCLQVLESWFDVSVQLTPACLRLLSKCCLSPPFCPCFQRSNCPTKATPNVAS